MTGIVEEITIGPARLILGDMREVLPALKMRADMVMSDPPYMLSSGGNNGELGGCFGRNRYDNGGALFDVVPWHEMAPIMLAACADNAELIIMATDREEARARAAFEVEGARFHRLLVWGKGTATPNRWFMPNCEFGLYLYKGKARRLNDCGARQMVQVRQMDVSHHYLPADLPKLERAPHPTEKPVKLRQDWISNVTDPGALVLDPFAGSGSTVVAAMRAGRRALAIEKDPKWFGVMVGRARDALEVSRAAFRRAGVAFPENGAVSAKTGGCGA